jgi:hypothetical protein
MFRRFLSIILVPALILIVTVGLILFARGFRFNPDEGVVEPTGILVGKSEPDGANIYVNEELEGATNSNINLSPGEYDVKIIKDGYHPWKKRITIKKELVSDAGGALFFTNPALAPLIATGVEDPVLSPDGTQIAYIASPSAEAKPGQSVYESNLTKPTLFIYDLRVANLPFSENPRPYNGTKKLLELQWGREAKTLTEVGLRSMPSEFATVATSSAKRIIFSEDGTKALYEATASATIKRVLEPPRYDTRSTVEEREINAGGVYVYDKKDDKNYKIPVTLSDDSTRHTLQWLGTSAHVIYTNDNSIRVFDYDGGVETVLYSGPFINTYVFPHPNAKDIIILANFNPELFSEPSLYSLSVR